MSTIEPGWYKDPAEPSTQRYWDGEGWLGDPIPADAIPPVGTPPSPVPARPLASTATTAPTPVPTKTPSPWPAGPTPGPGAASGPSGPSGPTGPAGWPGFRQQPLLIEPRPHGLRLAGAGERLVARLVDVLAVSVLCVIANAWFAIEYWRDIQPYLAGYTRFIGSGETNVESLPMPPESATLLLLLMGFVATAVWFAYEVPATGNSGQTLGKRLLGIKVVRLESEESLGFGRAFRRWSRLGLPTLFWTACCGLTFLLQLLDCVFVVIDRPLRQALHDKGAATVVIEVPRPGRPETARTSVSEPTLTGGRHADPR